MAPKTKAYDKPPISPVIPTVIWAAIRWENPSIYNNRMPGIPTIPANDHPKIMSNSGDLFMLALFISRLKRFQFYGQRFINFLSSLYLPSTGKSSRTHRKRLVYRLVRCKKKLTRWLNLYRNPSLSPPTRILRRLSRPRALSVNINHLPAGQPPCPATVPLEASHGFQAQRKHLGSTTRRSEELVFQVCPVL